MPLGTDPDINHAYWFMRWSIQLSPVVALRCLRVGLDTVRLARAAVRQWIGAAGDSPHVFFAPRGGMLLDMSLSRVMRLMQEAEDKAGREGYLDPQNKRAAVPLGLRSTFRQ